MLNYLHIQQIALIDDLNVDINAHLTVISGETGAGKSIIIDALQIALGERADNSLLQTGAERGEISAGFNVQQIPAAQQWLTEHELADGDECLLRRVLYRDGRSRSFINGHASSLQQLRELGELLIHIHSQHQHQALLKTATQREWLDAFAGHSELCKEVNIIYQDYRRCENELLQCQQATTHQDKKTLVEFQLQELKQLQLQSNEIATLEQQQKQLANAEQIIQVCQQALNTVSEEESSNILSLLYPLSQQLHSISEHHPRIKTSYELIQQAVIPLEEASHELKNYLAQLELNPELLAEIEQRLSAIYQLARKHRVAPTQLADLQQQLETQLYQLTHAAEKASLLAAELETIKTRYQNSAQHLSKSRQQAAKKLCTTISTQMKQLALPHGELHINFVAPADDKPHAYGAEHVEFAITTNVGQPPQPLHKVASGGELSRIALAIQVTLAEKIAIPTLIFDEVDVGIGGATAHKVGELLKQLARNAQILCITHLPQVAAQGDQHLHVSKTTVKNRTQTQLTLLSPSERLHEIARMLGGATITEKTLAHAQEMLAETEN